MSKKIKSETPDLADRILAYFRVQPYGTPQGLEGLSADLSDHELKDFVGKDECDAILKRMENDKFVLPEKAADRPPVARRKAVENALDKLVKSGDLTRIKMDGPGQTGMGYYYSGPARPTGDESVGDLKELPIDQIRIDPKIQCRAKGVDPKRVEQYAADADKLPAVRVFHLPDGTYLLSRGFTRMAAWHKAGYKKVPVEVVKGDRDAAKLDAIGDNATHGAARTGDDIREAVGKYLSMPGRKNASVASVADAVKVAWATADRYVRALRRASGTTEKPAKVTAKSGKEMSQPKAGDTAETAAAPETPAPDAEAAPPAPPADTGIKDRAGNPVPAELVPDFSDTRMRDSIGNILANLKFIRAVKPDGYTLLSIPVKERDGILNDIEYNVATLQQGLPYAVCPADATAFGDQFKTAVRRKWMDKAEWEAYQKVKAGQDGTIPAKGKRGKKVKAGKDGSLPAKPKRGKKGKAAEAVNATAPEGNGQPVNDSAAVGDQSPDVAPSAEPTDSVQGAPTDGQPATAA
jgi:hypothetical protein